jgi:hypothetical protein
MNTSAFGNNSFAISRVLDSRIEHTALRLERNNIRAFIAPNIATAKKQLIAITPSQSEIFPLALNSMGVIQEFSVSEHSPLSDAETTTFAPNHHKGNPLQNNETSGYMIGGVHAVTENEGLLIFSITGAQLVRYVSGEVHAIWIVGAQKIVSTMEEGLTRVAKYTLPPKGAPAFLNDRRSPGAHKPLIVYKEFVPGRSTVILVKEQTGFFSSAGGKLQ